ncbi:MAG: FIST C-terminal domain-containing protein [Pseudomonadota bacterium]
MTTVVHINSNDMNSSDNAIKHLPLNASSLEALLLTWNAEYPHAGVLALLPERENDNLHILQACCRNQDIPLAGAIFPALLIGNEFHQEGVLLFRFDQWVPSFLIPEINDGQSPAEEKIAQVIIPAIEATTPDAAKQALYLIFDGLLPNIASILEGLYLQLSDRVSYAGVNAGSETFQPMPCLFDTDRVVGGGALCLLVPGQNVTVLEHGYTAPKHVMNATSTDGNQIISIDWRPAFEVYQKIIKQEYGIALTQENFYHYAVHFPFGIPRANEDVVVRIPVVLNEDGSLFCVGEVPENAMLVLLRAPEADEGRCISRLAASLQANNGSLQGRSILTFYCAGRRMHLGESSLQELTNLQQETGAAYLAGALSLGEIGSTGESDYPMFHNATLVCTPWGTT